MNQESEPKRLRKRARTCSCCKIRPSRKGQRTCKKCHREKMKAYRDAAKLHLQELERQVRESKIA